MNVTEDSTNTLVLADRSWWITTWCARVAAVLLVQSLVRHAPPGRYIGVLFLTAFGLAFLRTPARSSTSAHGW